MKIQCEYQAIIRDENEDCNKLVFEPKRILSADLGVNILAAVTDNTGENPVLIKGKTLKCINQRYNKQYAHLLSALRNGKQKWEGNHWSRSLEKLTNKRNRKIDDYLHKASCNLVNLAIERNIDTIVIGKNNGWKQECDTGKKNNQNFVQIPHSRFISMVKYKAERLGIQVTLQEESYTSKACFISNDEIPVYNSFSPEIKPAFSGTRKERSWYKIKGLNILVHADINGSANILRKRFPGAFDGVNRHFILKSPQVNKIA